VQRRVHLSLLVRIHFVQPFRDGTGLLPLEEFRNRCSIQLAPRNLETPGRGFRQEEEVVRYRHRGLHAFSITQVIPDTSLDGNGRRCQNRNCQQNIGSMIISKKVEFSASHICRAPGLSDAENERIYGAAANPLSHGHNYVVEVAIEGEPDPVTGMILDLKRLKDVLEERVLSVYDHRLLNREVASFENLVPTVENIAIDIWKRIERHIDASGRARLHSVRVHETSELFVEYRGGA
jgi:6-pyruvoyltetrahydropterin/6-carboxytetrahydropterin synthase